MYQFPQLQSTHSFLDKNILGGADEAEDIPMAQTNGLALQENDNLQLPGRPMEDYEDAASIRSSSRMTDVAEPANARNFFERIASPSLSLNSNFSRPPYLNDRPLQQSNDVRRSGINSPNNGYQSANEVDQRRQQQRFDNEQLPRSASFNCGRSNYNNQQRQSYPPEFNPHMPPPQNYMRGDSQQQQGPQQEPYARGGGDQYSQNSTTHDSFPTLNSPQQDTYVNENGYRTLPQQSFHSQPRRYGYENGMGYPPYNNNFNGMQYRPRRWRPPVTNNFNFINLPFNHQFYGYPQQAQQMIDFAQQAASLATLRTAHQHDYNIARNTQRIIPVKEENEDEDDLSIVYAGPKTTSKTRKRKSGSTHGSSSSLGSDDSVIEETASNATLTSQVPSKQSRSGTAFSSNYSIATPRFSSAPELPSYCREVETPIPQMLGLRIDTVANPKNNDMEEGEIVDIDVTKDDMTHDQNSKPTLEVSNSKRISAALFHQKPKTVSEVPLDRNPEFMFQSKPSTPATNNLLLSKPLEYASTPAEDINTSVASTYDPSHPLYNPLLDEEDPMISNAEALALADSVNLDDEELLDDYETQEAKKAEAAEDQMFKKFPDLRLTENTTDEKMNE